MSVTSVTFLLAALLTVSVVIQVIDAQVCRGLLKCKAPKQSTGQDKDDICKTSFYYISCMGDYGCDSEAEAARKVFTANRCLDAQICQGASNCTHAAPSDGQDKDKVCNATSAYLFCLEDNGCDSLAKETRKTMTKMGCLDAQICQGASNCTPAAPSDGQDKDKVCKAIRDRVTCLENNGCDSLAETSRKAWTKMGCSIDAQTCRGASKCTHAVPSEGQDRGELCKAGLEFLSCLEDNRCDSEAETVRKGLTQAGCSIDAQICLGASKCTPAVPSEGQDRGELCKATSAYLSCLEDNRCNSLAEKTRKTLTKIGCSGSGAPVLSFLTMVLGVVICRFLKVG